MRYVQVDTFIDINLLNPDSKAAHVLIFLKDLYKYVVRSSATNNINKDYLLSVVAMNIHSLFGKDCIAPNIRRDFGKEVSMVLARDFLSFNTQIVFHLQLLMALCLIYLNAASTLKIILLVLFVVVPYKNQCVITEIDSKIYCQKINRM